MTERADEDRGPPASVLGSRLAACDEVPPAWRDDSGLVRAKETAFRLQQLRGYTRWNELVALTDNVLDPRWMPEVGGLLGIVGEQVLIAIEAEAEKGAAQLAITRDENASLTAWGKRSLRTFAELQANQVFVGGHALANLTLRTLRLHSGFDPEPAIGLESSAFLPRSTERRAWISLNPETVARLQNGARVLGLAELQALVEVVDALLSDARWVRVMELRHTQYHRWRSESPGVTGVNVGDTALERLERGEVVGLGSELLPAYVEGDTMLADLVATSRDALDVFVDALDDYCAAWQQALGILANPP